MTEISTRHIVLAGDSIFDNDEYVMGEPGVTEQLRRGLPKGWSAFKIAVDGDCIEDVANQLANLPTHATDLIVSVGGNNTMRHRDLIDRADDFSALPGLLAEPLAQFRAEYQAMLATLKGLGLSVRVCTIYTAVPFEEELWRAVVPLALNAFNAVIIEEADKAGLEVIRLDHVCTEADDFATISPIEPSCQGGQKIVDEILRVMGVGA